MMWSFKVVVIASAYSITVSFAFGQDSDRFVRFMCVSMPHLQGGVTGTHSLYLTSDLKGY